MTSTLRIRLFGTFEVERDGVPIPETDWHTQQAKQVLKILILARGRPVPSERLMEWLWPGANPGATSTTLRSTIHALRRALEPQRPPRVPSRYVVTRSPGYAFQPDENTWVDVYAFETFLRKAERTRHAGEKRAYLTQALDLYRGDLLEEDPYAEWVLLERERLREKYLDALLELAELYAQEGALDRAIAACRRALARDEFRESAYRALMRYHVLAGDVAAALNTYERCRTMLRQEFGAEPAPQTQALYQAILRGEIQTVLPAPTAASPAPPATPTTESETPPTTPPLLASWPILEHEELLERMLSDESLAREIVEAFLQDAPDQLEALHQAIDNRDFTAVRERAHTLKGAAGNVSGIALHELAKALEEAAKNQATAELDELRAHLAPALDNLTNAFADAGLTSCRV